jgi:hypothetical protein
MITAATATTSGASSIAVLFGLLAAIAAYWVPTIVAMIRQVPNKGSIIVINLFLGWSVIGWIVALAMACRSRPQLPQYVVPPGWAPPGAGPAGWTPAPGPQEPGGPVQWPGPQI